ncbi:MAG TPA: winged helix-turn-helix domain-containing protein [Terriglobales bacterium]|nr:winged helix-turn-helix domain-containing protein [Terriglobales bacterium]
MKLALDGVVTAGEFHFGDFVLDQSRFRLQKGEQRIRLEKLPMELLILLVQRQGELVTRDQIAERLWGKDVFLDVDHSINVAVRKIRVVLRDDPEKPRFVETVVGKGYRFAARVSLNGGTREHLEATDGASSENHPVSTSGMASVPVEQRVTFRRSALWLVAMAVSGMIALLWVLRSGDSRVANQPPIRSLAVLPLTNLSADPTQEYLADGLTEDLIGRLAGIPGLQVISRTSSMHFKKTQLSVPEIARALQVDAIVEGSVIREGNQIRIHAQLIRAATDEHIWAGEYERENASILALQEEVAGNIAERVETSLMPKQHPAVAAARRLDPEAYEAYLKGRYYFNQRTVQALNKSIEYFQQAIGRDPNYALAYSGLADTYALLGFRGRVPSKDALVRAKSAALKAIELDDRLADPHASLAFIAETHEWDWTTAEKEYKRALELNPDDARTHHWYAGYLTYVGRVREGIEEEMRARELDPLSLPINNALAGRLLAAGRYQEALQQAQKTLELDAHFPQAHQTLGWVYLNTSKGEDAVREFRNALQLSGPDDSDLMLDLGFAYAATGQRDEAQKILAELKGLHRHGLAESGSVGILYGALGERDQAFAWLNRAFDEHDPELTYIKAGRRFEPLRKDPRFELLVQRVGLPG